MTLERGALLNNRYRIVDILGQGGMASVYRAVDENLGVEVAVKENFFTTEEYARQFRLEATILASLRHAHMPRVTDHFVIHGQGQYLVMDYIEGEDLRERMDRVGTLTEEEIIIIGVAICDALTYLHSRKPTVLHRDIKPGNVKINPHGEVYLVDFGLAKVVDDANITTTGARAMTPGYSPPEQYGTARTDSRSDIYSLGATLYSAATDALPEDGLSRAMEQTSLTPVREHNPKISKRLANIIEKALEVRPDDRHQTAEAFKQALINSRGTSRRRMPLESALSPPPRWLFTEDPREQYQGSSGSINPVVRSGLNSAGEGVLSPPYKRSGTSAGNDREFVSRKLERRRSLWFSFLALGLILLLFAFYYAEAGPFFRSLLPSLSPGMEPSSTQPGELPASPTPTEDRPADDTTALFITGEPTRTTLLTFTPSPTGLPTSTPTFESSPPRAETQVPALTATLSPTPVGGGMPQLAFASDRSGYTAIWLMNLDGTGLQQLTFIEEGACQPTWSPDGSQLIFISPCPRNQEFYPASSLFLINADGSDLIPLPTAPGGDFDPTWSPDGTRIAFTSLRRNNNAQIFLLDLSTQEVTHLPDPDGRQNFQPAWSADGKIIAFVGPRNQIWTMNADGSDRYLVSRPSDFANRFPSWSPNGRTIIFTQLLEDLTGTPWLAAVQADEGAIAHIIARDVHMTEASYSPDGFWIIYQSRQAGHRDIYIMSHNGVNRQRVTNNEFNNFDPAWRPSSIKPLPHPLDGSASATPTELPFQ
jgi:eukaryotic-like serine/threonine-protein kinase